MELSQLTAKKEIRFLISILVSIYGLSISAQTLHTEYKYPDPSGKNLLIQNSFPKGGLIYTDPSGKDYVYTIFWTRMINETNSHLELSIDIPNESFRVPSSINNSFKVFLPPYKMTAEKEPLFNYGLTELEFFLDKNINKPSSLKRTLVSGDTVSFYVITLFEKGVQGVVRTGFQLHGEELIYTVNGREIQSGKVLPVKEQ